MADAVKEFFSQQHNQELIKDFLKKFRAREVTDESYSKSQKHLINFFQILQANTEFFDINCPSNINWIGDSLIGYLNRFSGEEKDSIEDLIQNITPMVFRLLLEAQFNFKGELSFELNSVINYLESLIDPQPLVNSFNGQMIWARYLMPTSIIKNFIQHENMADITAFNKRIDDIESLKSTWDDELNKKIKIVDDLKNKIENYKTAFNFVGLYQGFENLSLSKNKELWWARLILATLGTISVIPVLIEIFLFLFKSKQLFEYKDILLYAIFPTLTLQLILIYFFRVSLLNFKSIKAQLLQIELRKTLCQFIQNYSDFAKDIKSKDSGSLEKFESLIFSGLITNEENLPSTFDGIEQISKVLQSIKTTN